MMRRPFGILTAPKKLAWTFSKYTLEIEGLLEVDQKELREAPVDELIQF